MLRHEKYFNRKKKNSILYLDYAKDDFWIKLLTAGGTLNVVLKIL